MPREVHEHYEITEPGDTVGKLVGYTVITRETEWDDETRDRALALHDYENSLCGCGCGRPAAETLQKHAYLVHEATCYAGRALEQHRRNERKKHEETSPEGWDDGKHYYVELADDKLTDAQAAAMTTTRKRGVKRGD